jgi:hypothetical protein
MLERAATAASDDPTLDAIEAIRAVLNATVAEDLASEAGAGDYAADDLAGAAGSAGSRSTPGHGRIRLHGRP